MVIKSTVLQKTVDVPKLQPEKTQVNKYGDLTGAYPTPLGKCLEMAED